MIIKSVLCVTDNINIHYKLTLNCKYTGSQECPHHYGNHSFFPLQTLCTNKHAYYTNTGCAKKCTQILRDVIYVLFFKVELNHGSNV